MKKLIALALVILLALGAAWYFDLLPVGPSRSGNEAAAGSSGEMSSSETGETGAQDILQADPNSGAVALSVDNPAASDVQGYWWSHEQAQQRVFIRWKDGTVHQAIDGSIGSAAYFAAADCDTREPDPAGRVLVTGSTCMRFGPVVDDQMTVTDGYLDMDFRRVTGDEAAQLDAMVARQAASH